MNSKSNVSSRREVSCVFRVAERGADSLGGTENDVGVRKVDDGGGRRRFRLAAHCTAMW